MGPIRSRPAPRVARPVSGRLEELERRDTPTFVGLPPFTTHLVSPTVIAAADFNGDGKADVAIGNDFGGPNGSAFIGIGLGNGDGSFAPGQQLVDPAGETPAAITVADLDRDGDLDLAAAFFPTFFSTLVFLNNGDGTFAAPITVDPNAAVAVGTADFNRDGIPDLVSVSSSFDNPGYRVFLGNGDGTFRPPGGVGGFQSAPLTGEQVVTADFDADGNPDFAGIRRTVDTPSLVTVYGNGDGTFDPPVLTPLGFTPNDLVAGDFDGDGLADVVIAEDDTVNFRRNLGGRSFDPGGVAVLTPGPVVDRLASADFDRNGLPDVVAVGATGSRVAYSLGGGRFAPDPGNPYASPPGSFGNDVATADFDGDGNVDFVTFGEDTLPGGNAGEVFINLAPDDTQTQLTAAPNPSQFAQPVTFTATVTPLVPPFPPTTPQTPTGTVTFFVDGASAATAPVVNGTATFTTSALTIGSHAVVAQYSEDPSPTGVQFFRPSTSNTVTQVVNPYDTRTVLSTDPNPSEFGQPVALTATVAATVTPFPPAGPPAGTVTFFVDGAAVGTAPLGNGTATFTTSTLAAGSHQVLASYSGDPAFRPSTSNTVTQVVNPAPTRTTLSSAPNPSDFGQAVTFTAAVAPVASPGPPRTPTGTVTFFVDGAAVATVDLTGGTATFTTTTLAAGSHEVVASYSGDPSFRPSASNIVTQAVNPPPPPPTSRTFQYVATGPQGSGAGDDRPAIGSFTPDGTLDFVIGTGPGEPARVSLIDGATSTVLTEELPFGAAFTGGVFVAAGDIDGDGVADLAVAADRTGGPRVRIYLTRDARFVPVADFFALDPDFRGGLRVALGDVNRDGAADLVVTAGNGGGPRVATYDGRTLFGGAVPARLWNDFFGLDPDSRLGAFVAVGDLDGDGFGEIVLGADAGGGPRVAVYDGRSLAEARGPVMVANFFSGPATDRGGIRVAARDLDGDRVAELLTGSGTGSGSRIRIYEGRDVLTDPDPEPFFEFDAIPGSTGGVYVA